MASQGEMLVELKSLGISPNRINEFNDRKELSDLANLIKMAWYQEYKATYSNNNEK